jgi:hypothetical protein
VREGGAAPAEVATTIVSGFETRDLLQAPGSRSDRTTPLGSSASIETALAGQGNDHQAAARELRTLVDRFQREALGARAAGVLPVAIAFPEVGPMVYLAAELTPEGSSPLASFTFKRTVK